MLLLTLLLLALLSLLQISLAKKGLWISLILPSIFFVISIYLTVKSPYLFARSKWIRPMLFIITNIPTIIFLGIYYEFKKI